LNNKVRDILAKVKAVKNSKRKTSEKIILIVFLRKKLKEAVYAQA